MKNKIILIAFMLSTTLVAFNSCKKEADPIVVQPAQVAVGGMCVYGHFDGNDCTLPTTNCLCEVVVTPTAAYDRLIVASSGGATSIPLVQEFFNNGDYKSVFPALDSSDGGKILLNKFKGGSYAMLRKQNPAGENKSFFVAGSPLQLQNNEAEWVFPVRQ